MADLVPEVPEDRPVRLVHQVPTPLALGVVGLGDVDRDHPVIVPGQHGDRPGVPGSASARNSKARPPRGSSCLFAIGRSSSSRL